MSQNFSELKINDNTKLNWLGHAGFKINHKNLIIYIDPYQLEDSEKADIILITHSHYDHCSISDIQKILKNDTVIVAPVDCTSKFAGKIENKNEVISSPGKNFSLSNIKITAVPAYNVGKQFHPKENAWTGYIIDLNGVKIYHAGDTDLIPEMNGLDVDIAILPVGGTYTMNAKEAAKACDMIKPKMFAIPMHYKTIVGSETNAYEFKQNAKCDVKIL